jgi:tripartite-type tricarboxylate transporter receptor subunit TctC
MPTLASTGLPGYEYETASGIFATARTPAPVITRLNQEIVRYLKTPEAKERLLNIGVEAIGSSPEQFEAAVRADMTRLGKVIKDAGIRAE